MTHAVSVTGLQRVDITITQQELERAVSRGEVSNKTLYHKLIANYKDKIHVPISAYIKDGVWYDDVEYNHSHSWTETVTIRDATEEECDMMDRFKQISKFVYEN